MGSSPCTELLSIIITQKDETGEASGGDAGQRSEIVRVRGGGVWRSGTLCPARPWPELFACLRPRHGSTPRGIGGRSSQSQFHHLGANLPLLLPSPPHFTWLQVVSQPLTLPNYVSQRKGFPLPKANLDSDTVMSWVPQHRYTQASSP